MATPMAPAGVQTYALLRIVSGFLFLWHGCEKLFGYPGAVPEGTPAYILYIAGPIELVGGACLVIGLFTRWAAFLCSGLMAAGYWMAHGMNGFLPIENGGELAVLYCFVFIFIWAQGPGVMSMDAARSKS